MGAIGDERMEIQRANLRCLRPCSIHYQPLQNNLICFSLRLPRREGNTNAVRGKPFDRPQIKTGLHLLINALSTILLNSSNYCMQCFSAPTRKELDKAHSKGKWLDTGVMSTRNLRHIATKRVVLWWLLGVSSLPLHLFKVLFFPCVRPRLNLPQLQLRCVRIVDGRRLYTDHRYPRFPLGPIKQLHRHSLKAIVSCRRSSRKRRGRSFEETICCRPFEKIGKSQMYK